MRVKGKARTTFISQHYLLPQQNLRHSPLHMMRGSKDRPLATGRANIKMRT